MGPLEQITSRVLCGQWVPGKGLGPTPACTAPPVSCRLPPDGPAGPHPVLRERAAAPGVLGEQEVPVSPARAPWGPGLWTTDGGAWGA